MNIRGTCTLAEIDTVRCLFVSFWEITIQVPELVYVICVPVPVGCPAVVESPHTLLSFILYAPQ